MTAMPVPDGASYDSISEDGRTFFEMVAWPDGDARVARFAVYEVIPNLSVPSDSDLVVEGTVDRGGCVDWQIVEDPDTCSLEQFARFLGALAGAVEMAAGHADAADVAWLERYGPVSP